MPADPQTLLPLKPVEYLLLLALVEAEQHGYALAKEIAERTDGVVTLEPGNLYRSDGRCRTPTTNGVATTNSPNWANK
jgi:hypothetical protein